MEGILWIEIILGTLFALGWLYFRKGIDTVMENFLAPNGHREKDLVVEEDIGRRFIQWSYVALTWPFHNGSHENGRHLKKEEQKQEPIEELSIHMVDKPPRG